MEKIIKSKKKITYKFDSTYARMPSKKIISETKLQNKKNKPSVFTKRNSRFSDKKLPKYPHKRRTVKQQRFSLEEKLKLRYKNRVEFIKKLVLPNLYCLNILSTKTNHFCSITMYVNGHVPFLETPRMQGFKHTMRRKDTALQATLHLLFKKFFKAHSRSTAQFILQFTGRKSFLVKKTVRMLLKRMRIKKRQIYLIRIRQFFSHNGCKLQIRKRKKRKGRRTRFEKQRATKL